MYFVKFSDVLVKVEKDKKKRNFGRLQENVGSIPLTVVIMTFANGINTFSVRLPKFLYLF